MMTEGQKKQSEQLPAYGITAAILAGGLGTRLRPIIGDRPKVLAEIGGKPFLTYLLDQLVDVGVERVVLCTGYLGGQVREALGDVYRNLQLMYSQEAFPLGTGGALRFALPMFESDAVMVMNGDSFCQVDLATFWRWHVDQHARATLLLTKVGDTSPYGRVQIDAQGIVRMFHEKESHAGGGWVNAGRYVINRSLLELIPYGTSVSLETQIFPKWVEQGLLHGVRLGACLLDIGTPERYLLARKHCFAS